jgi:hypothetical protein
MAISLFEWLPIVSCGKCSEVSFDSKYSKMKHHNTSQGSLVIQEHDEARKRAFNYLS